MRLTLPTETLQKALARVASIPGGRGTPVSSTVKMEAGMAGFQILRLTPEAQIALSIEEGVSLDNEGIACLSHAEFSSLVSRIGAKEVTLHDDETTLHLEWGKGAKAKIAKFAEDFEIDAMPEEKAAHKFSMEVKEFTDALEFASVAASIETARANLCGVRLQKLDGKFCFIGTDGRRMHILTTKLKCDAHCTIPSEAVDAMRKAMMGEGDKAMVQVGDGSISIDTPNLKMRFQLLAEGFPNIEAVMKIKAADLTLGSFNKAELSEALGTLIPIGEGDFKAVEIEVGKSEAKISAAGAVTSAIIPVSVSAKKSFHVRLSAESLKAALPWFEEEKDSIALGLYAPMNAIVIQQSDRVATLALQVTTA